MAERTAIAWTDHTWNPWMGCHKVSQGCKHCYAEVLTKERMGLDVWGLNGPRRRTLPKTWAKVRRWNNEAIAEGRPHRVFTASLADVFEDEPGPNEWRSDVFDVIRNCPWLDFQLLTKRPENFARMLPDDWGEGYTNVWLGTSIENNEVVDRAEHLTSVPAFVHFVSYEPAIGPVNELDLRHIEWLIAGGESGPGFRPMDFDWIRDIRERCDEYGTAFFFKQSAAYRTESGIYLDGELVRNYPKSYDRLEAILELGEEVG